MQPPACAWSKGSSTTAQRTRTTRALAPTSPARAPRPTAAHAGPSWPPSPSSCRAWFAICQPRAWPNWDRSVTTASAGPAAAARTCKVDRASRRVKTEAQKKKEGCWRSSRGHDGGENLLAVAFFKVERTTQYLLCRQDNPTPSLKQPH